MSQEIRDTKSSYSQFHIKNKSKHLYPTEWVIRTMLGNYPELYLDKSNYAAGKILDLGFGDCRNMQLLANCGLDIYGVEITDDIVNMATETMNELQIPATLKVGTNSKIPFEDNYFDYLLASSSCYYVDADSSFTDNLFEIFRVIKPGGYFIANFPAFSPVSTVPESFILEKCDFTHDNHVIIRNDIYGIRNGYKFKAFKNAEELKNTLEDKFDNISIGYTLDNYYGVQINTFILSCRKRA